jgi:hypothetical protein
MKRAISQPGRGQIFAAAALRLGLVFSTLCSPRAVATGQDLSPASEVEAAIDADDPKASPTAPLEKVDVAPSVSDDEIASRLVRILQATGWFQEAKVRVDEGVVFLTGTARDEDVKQWAGDLARRTEDGWPSPTS